MTFFKRHKIFSLLIIIILALVAFIGTYIVSNPSAQLLISVVGFSENTLKNPAYLAYNIDLMDLFQNYMNADVVYEGEAYISRTDSFAYSTSGSIKGQRSCSQKKMSMETDMSVLWKDLGGINLYAQDETVYLVVPMLNNISYAFDTDVDLFKKGPELTSDISREWFHDNLTNIIDFLGSIDIEKTGKTYVDEDGTISYEYLMTVPQGQGQFIWDLLGMDTPEYDITASIYLDKSYSTRRIEFDLSHSIDGATLVIDGANCGTCIMTIPLPDNESAVMTISRNADVYYTNSFACNMTYNANTGKVYTIDSTIETDYLENGMSTKISDMEVKEGEKVLASGYTTFTVQKVDDMEDVFKDVDVDLDEIDVINWKVIRDDTEGFIEDLTNKAKENMSILSIFSDDDETEETSQFEKEVEEDAKEQSEED